MEAPERGVKLDRPSMPSIMEGARSRDSVAAELLDPFNAAALNGDFDAAIAVIRSGSIWPFNSSKKQEFACRSIANYCGADKGKIKDLAINPKVIKMAQGYNYFSFDKSLSLPLLKFFGESDIKKTLQLGGCDFDEERSY